MVLLNLEIDDMGTAHVELYDPMTGEVIIDTIPNYLD